MKNHKGFTLIELLVVIAIIAILSTLAVVALGNARQKSRDAKRLADLKQIQTALELYYLDQAKYPAKAAGVLGGDDVGPATDYVCMGSTDGLGTTIPCAGTMYMGTIPKDPGDKVYQWVDNAAGGGASYAFYVTLEGAAGGYASGVVCAKPNQVMQVAATGCSP